MHLLGRLFYGAAKTSFDNPIDRPRDWLVEVEGAVMGTLTGLVTVLFLWAFGSLD